MSSTVILLNEQNPQGIFVDPSVPLISVDDQGFTRGDGVFETMLSVNRRVRKLGMHLSRLESSARMLDLPTRNPRFCVRRWSASCVRRPPVPRLRWVKSTS